MNHKVRDRVVSLGDQVCGKASFDKEVQSMRRRESRLFPLFSEMGQAMNVPPEIYFICQAILVIRFLCCGLWPSSARCWEGESTGIVGYLQMFYDFGFTSANDDARLPVAVIFIVIAFLILCWHVLLYQVYAQTHIFPKWQLFVTRVIQQGIIRIILSTYSSMAGAFLKNVFVGAFSLEGSGSMNSVLLAFTLVAGAFLALVFYLSYGFACYSPILMYQALTCSWNPLPVYAMLALQLLCTFAAPVLDLFAAWVTPFFILISIIGMVVVVAQVRFFPFQRFGLNIVFMAFAVFACILQLFVAFILFGFSPSPMIFTQ
jgi:hypothetical protein